VQNAVLRFDYKLAHSSEPSLGWGGQHKAQGDAQRTLGRPTKKILQPTKWAAESRIRRRSAARFTGWAWRWPADPGFAAGHPGLYAGRPIRGWMVNTLHNPYNPK